MFAPPTSNEEHMKTRQLAAALIVSVAIAIPMQA